MKIISVVLLALLAACTPEAVIVAVAEKEVVEHIIPEIVEIGEKEMEQHRLTETEEKWHVSR